MRGGVCHLVIKYKPEAFAIVVGQKCRVDNLPMSPLVLAILICSRWYHDVAESTGYNKAYRTR